VSHITDPIKAVAQFLSSWFILAQFSNKNLTIFLFQFIDAIIKAVAQFSSCEFIFIHCSKNIFIVFKSQS